MAWFSDISIFIHHVKQEHRCHWTRNYDVLHDCCALPQQSCNQFQKRDSTYMKGPSINQNLRRLKHELNYNYTAHIRVKHGTERLLGWIAKILQVSAQKASSQATRWFHPMGIIPSTSQQGLCSRARLVDYRMAGMAPTTTATRTIFIMLTIVLSAVMPWPPPMFTTAKCSPFNQSRNKSAYTWADSAYS